VGGSANRAVFSWAELQAEGSYSVSITAGTVPITGQNVTPFDRPVLTLVTPGTQPTWELTINQDILAGDVWELQRSSSPAFTTVDQTYIHTVLTGELLGEFEWPYSNVPAGIWYYRSRLVRASTNSSLWSNTVSDTVPFAAPNYGVVITAGTVPIIGQSILPFDRPILTLVAAGAKPTWELTINQDILAGDVWELQRSSSPTHATIAETYIHTIGAGELLGEFEWPYDNVPLGLWYWRSRLIRNGTNSSLWSNTVSYTAPFSLQAGIVPITGQDVVGRYGRNLPPITAGVVPVTGQNVIGRYGRVVPPVTAGTVPITGQAVSPALAYSDTLVAGSVSIAGQIIAIAFGRQPTVAPGTVPITGQNVVAGLGPILTITAGSVPVTGQTVTPSFSGSSVLYRFDHCRSLS
jgi:hypothetical protein